jgi:hypothetical protein
MRMTPVQSFTAGILTDSVSRDVPDRESHTVSDQHAERVVFWTITLVPLWWILGIQILVYPLVGGYLLFRSWYRPHPVPLLVGWHLWCGYIIAWLVSLLMNLALGVAEVGRSLNALGAILGVWVLTVAVWYAMRRLRVRFQVVVRAACIVGLCQLIAVVIGEGYLRLTGSILETRSLVTLLWPSIPARVFFEAKLYGLDRIAWEVDPVLVPRLLSFYYWSPLAGTMSLILSQIALTEENRFWRWVGLIGAVLTLRFSAARMAQLAFGVATLISLWFGSRWGRRIMNWLAIPIAAASPFLIGGFTWYLFNYRRDSFTLRREMYREAFEAFLESPFLGYGAQGHSRITHHPLGSHSQVISTLYQTGAIGSALLILAWIAIAVALLNWVLKHPHLAPCLGAWVGLTFIMLTEEYHAASVTAFVLSAWLGCAWNWGEQAIHRQWLPPWIQESPLPWQRRA